MLDKSFFENLKSKMTEYESVRREIIRFADDVRNASKRAIFAMHRDDFVAADDLLAGALRGIGEMNSRAVALPDMLQEGSYRSALEEYVEARLYRDFLQGKTLGPVDVGGRAADYDTYFGGLSDLCGELQRRQVRVATAGDLDGVRAIRDEIEGIVGLMMEADLTGYLRNKFDQAKNGYRRAEEVLYEMTVRRS